MTIAEAERFYAQDEHKYILSQNRNVLFWLKAAVKKGYSSFIKVSELQDLIDNIVTWYEIKYPEREFEYYEGVRYFDFENMDRLSELMSLEQLLCRLPHRQLCLMQCDYRANGSGIRDIYDDDNNVIGHKAILFMSIKSKEEYHLSSMSKKRGMDFLLRADSEDGRVHIDYAIDDIVDKENITLDELLEVFKTKCSDEIDFTKLEECIFDHNCDMELRKQVLQLVALKLLYSERTIPERGYERAKRFINEFNKKMGLDLTTDEIDEIMGRDYSNGEKWEHVLKTFTDSEGEEQSYWTVENVNKKPSVPERVCGMVKSLFKK